MKYFYTIFGLLIFILLLGFALKNAEPVELQYYLGFSWRTSLSLMLLVTLFIGVIIGLLLCLSPLIGQKRRLLALERELKKLNTDIR